MKKLVLVLAMILLAFGLAGCGDKPVEVNPETFSETEFMEEIKPAFETNNVPICFSANDKYVPLRQAFFRQCRFLSIGLQLLRGAESHRMYVLFSSFLRKYGHRLVQGQKSMPAYQRLFHFLPLHNYIRGQYLLPKNVHLDIHFAIGRFVVI